MDSSKPSEEYKAAIHDAVRRIDATIIVSGESSMQLKEAILNRVMDLAKPTAHIQD
jgi:hypothetical protein